MQRAANDVGNIRIEMAKWELPTGATCAFSLHQQLLFKRGCFLVGFILLFFVVYVVVVSSCGE